MKLPVDKRITEKQVGDVMAMLFGEVFPFRITGGEIVVDEPPPQVVENLSLLESALKKRYVLSETERDELDTEQRQADAQEKYRRLAANLRDYLKAELADYIRQCVRDEIKAALAGRSN